jgi:hypothetical protein
MLQRGNRKFIHSLSTILVGRSWDNLWAACGSAVHTIKFPEIMGLKRADISETAAGRPRFYPKLSVTAFVVSAYQLFQQA